jgi:phospholipid/cholesterol/gamma-HCH transport system permease protein
MGLEASPLAAAPAASSISMPEPLSFESVTQVARALGSVPGAGGPVRIDMSRVRHVDTFGLAALASGVRRLRAGGRTVELVELDPLVRRRAALLRVHDVLESSPVPVASTNPIDAAWTGLRELVSALVIMLAMLYEGLRFAFVDCTTRALGREHLARQLDQIGLGGVPIVAGVNLLVGAIMAFQTAYVLEFYGATVFVARGVGISMTRELGPLMAAVLLAGRSGSAIAAELGAMVVYEEVDALEMMALEPRRFLLVPRFAALLVAVPALSLLADVCGIFGSAAVMSVSYRLPWSIYFEETVNAVYVTDIESGLIKSIFFGALIAVVSCHQGLSLRGGPEAVGRAATTAVVRSIIAVVVFDAAFTAATRGVL